MAYEKICRLKLFINKKLFSKTEIPSTKCNRLNKLTVVVDILSKQYLLFRTKIAGFFIFSNQTEDELTPLLNTRLTTLKSNDITQVHAHTHPRMNDVLGIYPESLPTLQRRPQKHTRHRRPPPHDRLRPASIVCEMHLVR